MTNERSDAPRDPLLGEIIAFAALPAMWVGQPPSEIARALAAAIDRTIFPEAVAIVLRTEQGTVEACAGREELVEADLRRYHGGDPTGPGVIAIEVGPLGRRGTILMRAPDLPPERLILARFAASLADTALRETALAHQAAATRTQLTKLEKLSALGQLVSGVAHELRTPLTYANNNAFIAQRRLARASGLSGDDRRDLLALLDEILAAHDRIEQTVGTLRRLASPRVEDRGALVLSEAAGEATRLFALTHVGGVLITRRFEGSGTILADRTEIQQVVLNLLQNAAEAVPDGARIHVATKENADTISLLVEDGGPGIPPENVGRLFEPFFTTKGGGMGLGLSIVRRIVEAHSATVSVGRSELGGARFEIRFPRAELRHAPASAASHPRGSVR